jgi:superfamily II DNA helicase RecQ
MQATTRATVRARVLNLPFRGGDPDGFDDSELVRLLADKEGAQVSEHFFTHQSRPYLACFVRWNEPCGGVAASRAEAEPWPGRNGAAAEPSRPSRRRSRAAARADHDHDSRPVLDPIEQRVHDALRAWRAARARELGVPAYRVLTNRQLEALARARPSDPGLLLALEGIGPATARVHGDAIVARIREAAVASPATGAA